MDEDRRNLLDRREIVSAYAKVLARPDELARVCAGVSGDVDEAIPAVQDAFDVGEHAAAAILDLQVRRFTPRAIERVHEELAEIDRRLALIDDGAADVHGG